MSERILVAEDNESLREGIVGALEDEGYAVASAPNGMDAIRALESEVFHAVVSDIKLGDVSGVEILKKAKEINSETEVILMTAYATLESALQALRLGAFDYIQKPFDIVQLKHRVGTALRVQKMRGELEFFKKVQYRMEMGDGAPVAENPAMKEVLAKVRKVAPTSATILITGETGTGKEVVAGLVHFHSQRRDQPFDKGTIFLDEIGDMSSTIQSKVLRVMQEHEFERLGSSGKTVKVDVRVMAATNKDLRKEVQEGRFRQDLFFRLNVVDLNVPPVRERPEDILPLARYFLNRFASDFKKKVDGFSPDAIQKMRRYAWPGNVRELQNAIERAVLLCDGPLIGPADLTLESAQPGGEVPLVHETLVLEELERRAIERALRQTRGVQKDAAELLGITPRVLNYKIQVLNIDWKSFREA
jgi:DNA-binding NtrC family response regulator